MLVDFHVHSTASDGTREPRALAAEAEERGFAAIALTDHDNCDGVPGFRRSASGLRTSVCGPRLVAGIELSIDPGTGFDKFHLLGFGIDPENAPLKKFLGKVLDGRNARNERISANFARLGIQMPLDPKAALNAENPGCVRTDNEVVARPHYARWLLAHRYAESVNEAFDRYLCPESPDETRCYEERYHPSQEEAFAIVHGAGGICVMAHPKYWRKGKVHDYALYERELARLKEAGLDGLECLYQANTPEENVEFTRIAERLGLLKSAGSDYHGANKPTIPLGMEVSEAFIAPLLSRLESL